MFKSEFAETLGRIVAGNSQLAHLNLAKNMLRDEGIAKLCAGITHSRTLIYLNVSQNNLTPKGMADMFN